MQEQPEDWYSTMYKPINFHQHTNTNTILPVARQNHPHLPRPHHTPHLSRPLIHIARHRPLLRQLGQIDLVLVHQLAHPTPTLLRAHRLHYSTTNPSICQWTKLSHLRQLRRKYHNLGRHYRRETPHPTRTHERNIRSSNRFVKLQRRCVRNSYHTLQRW